MSCELMRTKRRGKARWGWSSRNKQRPRCNSDIRSGCRLPLTSTASAVLQGAPAPLPAFSCGWGAWPFPDRSKYACATIQCWRVRGLSPVARRFLVLCLVLCLVLPWSPCPLPEILRPCFPSRVPYSDFATLRADRGGAVKISIAQKGIPTEAQKGIPEKSPEERPQKKPGRASSERSPQAHHDAPAALAFSGTASAGCTRCNKPSSASRARRSAKSPENVNSAEPDFQLTRSSQSLCEGNAVNSVISLAEITTTGRSSASRTHTRVAVR